MPAADPSGFVRQRTPFGGFCSLLMRIVRGSANAGPRHRCGIFVAVEAADFRNGIDGLAALCRLRLAQDPLSGAVFVFRSRRGHSIKILAYDGQGFWLCLKRLSQGRFRHWPASPSPNQNVRLTVGPRTARSHLNGNAQAPSMAGDWKKVEQAGSASLDRK